MADTSFLSSILPDGVKRALVLKALRWAAAMASGALLPFLVNHGVNAADAASIVAAIAALILGGGSALFSALDAKNVDTKLKETKADTATTVATAIQTGQATPQEVTATAQSGSPEALKSLLTTLNAGQA